MIWAETPIVMITYILTALENDPNRFTRSEGEIQRTNESILDQFPNIDEHVRFIA